MPPDQLRERRDAEPVRSAISCMVSGSIFGVFTSLVLSLFFWKIRSPFPILLVEIGIGVAIVSSILRYWLMPYFSPSVVLLDESINLQFGRSTSRYRFANIVECRIRAVIGKNTHYSLLSIRSDLDNESFLFRFRLSKNVEIGVPETVDIEKVVQILRSGGVNIVTV